MTRFRQSRSQRWSFRWLSQQRQPWSPLEGPLANQGQVSSVAGATTVDLNSLSNSGPQSFTSGIASFSNLFIRTAVTTDIAGDTSPFADPTAASGDLTINFSKPIVYFGLY